MSFANGDYHRWSLDLGFLRFFHWHLLIFLKRNILSFSLRILLFPLQLSQWPTKSNLGNCGQTNLHLAVPKEKGARQPPCVFLRVGRTYLFPWFPTCLEDDGRRLLLFLTILPLDSSSLPHVGKGFRNASVFQRFFFFLEINKTTFITKKVFACCYSNIVSI